MSRRHFPWSAALALSAALGLATLGLAALGMADAASVKVRPQGEALTRAVQAALGAISTRELPVTLDSSSGTVMTLGGAGGSAVAFNPDVSARVVTVAGVRRIEFNPSGPLPLAQAVREELARELGFKDWTAEAARTRLSGADLNGDGRIDLIDLAILMQNYGKPGAEGDLNQDRKVDDADLRIFSAQYRPQPTVPEPEPKPAEPPTVPAAPAAPRAPETPQTPPVTPAAPNLPPVNTSPPVNTVPPVNPVPPVETAPKDAAPGTGIAPVVPSPPLPAPTPPAGPAPKTP